MVNYIDSVLVGDVRMNICSTEQYETVLRLLEQFMIEYKIDKIDVGWSRNVLVNSKKE